MLPFRRTFGNLSDVKIAVEVQDTYFAERSCLLPPIAYGKDYAPHPSSLSPVCRLRMFSLRLLFLQIYTAFPVLNITTRWS